MNPTVSTVPSVQSRPVGAKVAASLAGALLVAAAAQVAIPVPGSPVPFTMQPMAVLIVGGLLGARYGALSLVMYLAMGSAGLPVFTPVGLPGFARLFGPTGGFLLAYPFAAAVTGSIARRFDTPTLRLSLLAAFAGMIVIFVGGIAQLAVITPGHAINFGLLPFAPADLVKVLLAGLVIRRFAPSTRALS
jgi:biotin transport system substrate-specific component